MPPVVWESALGSRVRDVDGNVYVDLTAGFAVASVGHAHPRVVDAVRRQTERLVHGMGDVHPHDARAALAERLTRIAPVPRARVYFATSGAEAVEIALKTAQLATGRPTVAAFGGGYHGLSYGALRATSRPEFRRPFAAALAPATLWLPFPHVFRPPVRVPPPRLAEACLELTRERLLRARSVGALPGCVVVEPVQGREGIVVPPPGWLAELATLCRELGVLLVVDEIFTGFGRTGTWFRSTAEGVQPDVLLLGKGVAGGLPLAAAVAPEELFRVWHRSGEALHTSTFLAQPLACAAALATLTILEEERLDVRAARWEHDMRLVLERLRARQSTIGDVRGAGMMWGIELVARGGDLPDARRARAVAARCLADGVLLLTGGIDGNVLQLTPPLVLDRAEWEFAARVLDDAFAAAS